MTRHPRHIPPQHGCEIPDDVDSARDKPCFFGGLLIGLFIAIPMWFAILLAWRSFQ